ncbi:MAG: hypothetical protein LBC33_00415 [Mycoplasmataceae bacterium]|nr:hypothetical protein [Mycoplasmataceae bacterium]
MVLRRLTFILLYLLTATILIACFIKVEKLSDCQIIKEENSYLIIINHNDNKHIYYNMTTNLRYDDELYEITFLNRYYRESEWDYYFFKSKIINLNFPNYINCKLILPNQNLWST